MLDPLALTLKLCKALDVRQRCVQEAEDWYDGRHLVPTAPPNTPAAWDSEAAAAFRAMSELAVTNLLPPIVDVPASALRIEGFQFGETDTSSDREAWTIWQRNHLDADSPLANHAAVKTGQSFAMVWPDKDGLAEITVEDPSQVIVQYEAGSRRKRAAALKRWIDEDGYTLVTLYTPTQIFKYRSRTPTSTTLVIPGASSTDFAPRLVDGEPWPLPNPLAEVPVVELRANAPLKARPYGGGIPQFQKQINDQRKLNRTVMGLLVAEDNQMFRQRWATDWDYPTNPDGTPDKAAMARFSAARVFVANSSDEPEGKPVRLGEFAQADFRPFLDVLLGWVKVMASTSGTPPYAFLIGDMINVAADTLARIEGIQLGVRETLADSFAESWEEVMRLALKVEDNPKAADTSSSVVWAEFERRTATEQMGIAQGLKTLGAPDVMVFAAIPGVTQQQAERMVVEKQAEELRHPLPVAPEAAPAAPAMTPANAHP